VNILNFLALAMIAVSAVFNAGIEFFGLGRLCRVVFGAEKELVDRKARAAAMCSYLLLLANHHFSIIRLFRTHHSHRSSRELQPTFFASPFLRGVPLVMDAEKAFFRRGLPALGAPFVSSTRQRSPPSPESFETTRS
jgi:hypothetical protein